MNENEALTILGNDPVRIEWRTIIDSMRWLSESERRDLRKRFGVGEDDELENERG